MYLDQMRDRLRGQIGSPSVTDVPEAKLDEAINDAYIEITDTYRFHRGRDVSTFTLTSGQSQYALPGNATILKRISVIVNQDKKKLEKFADDMWGKLPIVNNSVPTHYVRYGSRFEIWPTPDDAYACELYHNIVVVRLVNGNDSPQIPEPWHMGIVRLARYYYYDDLGDLPKATTAYNGFQLWVQRKPVEFDEEKTDIDSGVRVPTLEHEHMKRVPFELAD